MSHVLITSIAYATSLVVTLSFGAFVLSRNSKNPTNRVFFLMCAAIAAYQLSFIIGINTSPEHAYWIWYTNIFEDVLITAFGLHFFTRASDTMSRFKPLLALVYGVGLLIMALAVVFPHYFVADVVPKLYLKSYIDTSGPLYYLIDAYFFIGFLLMFIVLFVARATQGAEGRKRIDYYLFALTFGFCTGATAFALDFNIPIDPAVSALLGLFVVPLVYGMVKKDLMDIRIVVRQTVLITLLITGITGLLTTVSLLSDMFSAYIPGFGYWTVPLVAALFSVGVGWLYWRKANETEHLKYEFITVVTHKFRTPLTRIRWGADLLRKETNLTAEAKMAADTVNGSVLELIQLSNLLVDAVRMERESYAYSWKEMSFEALIRKSTEPFADMLKTKKITLTVNAAANLPTVRVDEDRLISAVHVLIENAIVYTPEGGKVTIDLTARKRDTLKFAITDTGMGIAPEDISHIFGRFYRSDRARRADPQGIGLGLSMAKTIFERHRGTLGVTSEGAGKGSTFWFTLPAVR